MPAPKPRISREDFDALVRASGLMLSEEQEERPPCSIWLYRGDVRARARRWRTSAERRTSHHFSIRA